MTLKLLCHHAMDPVRSLRYQIAPMASHPAFGITWHITLVSYAITVVAEFCLMPLHRNVSVIKSFPSNPLAAAGAMGRVAAGTGSSSGVIFSYYRFPFRLPLQVRAPRQDVLASITLLPAPISASLT